MVLIGTDILHDGLRFPFGIKSGASITLFAGIRAIKSGVESRLNEARALAEKKNKDWAKE
jgi:hypothetical protein